MFARINTKLPLRFLDSTDGREGRADTVDISANGLGFVTGGFVNAGLLANEKLSSMTSLEIWLDIPDHHEPLYTRGEVVWSKALTDTGEHRVGVHLEKAELMGLARILWIKERSRT